MVSENEVNYNAELEALYCGILRCVSEVPGRCPDKLFKSFGKLALVAEIGYLNVFSVGCFLNHKRPRCRVADQQMCQRLDHPGFFFNCRCFGFFYRRMQGVQQIRGFVVLNVLVSEKQRLCRFSGKLIGIQQLKPINRHVCPKPCFILKRAAAVHSEEVSLALNGRVIHIQIRKDFQP